MKKISLIILVFISLTSFNAAQAGLYRWVDDAGEVHFSDKVPVTASRKKVSEMSKSGAVKNTVDPEAIALARLEFEANTVEREKQEALDKARQEKEATLKKRDDYLLSTYENKGELITSFETKIKLMKGNAAILTAQNTVLEKKLAVLLAQKFNENSPSKKDSIEKKVISVETTIDRYKKALQQNESERIIISKNYNTNIERYLELTQ